MYVFGEKFLKVKGCSFLDCPKYLILIADIFLAAILYQSLFLNWSSITNDIYIP